MMHQNLAVTIKARPAQLIEALQRNKARHLEDYKAAVVGYWEDLEAKIRQVEQSAADEDIVADHTITLRKPINNEKLYDKYIGMLSMATDEVIEITSEDYGCIVDDNWEWAISAAASNSFYSKRRYHAV